ncbi:hypothetical protein VNO77_25021 [Canavalia gladiata]|uniref:Uncharacterized protein n=1 Tax=Canavalia gladiata TaxID=3824 RepID=A0AAN9LCJ9_CANGL
MFNLQNSELNLTAGTCVGWLVTSSLAVTDWAFAGCCWPHVLQNYGPKSGLVASLGLEAIGFPTEDSPLDGEGDDANGDGVEDGPGPGPWTVCGDEDGEVAGGEVVGPRPSGGGVGAGEGAWPVDIDTRAKDKPSTSMARVSAMDNQETKEWLTLKSNMSQRFEIDIYIYRGGKGKLERNEVSVW